MGRNDLAQILQELNEEGQADKKRTSIAEQGINRWPAKVDKRDRITRRHACGRRARFSRRASALLIVVAQSTFTSGGKSRHGRWTIFNGKRAHSAPSQGVPVRGVLRRKQRLGNSAIASH